MDDEIDIQPPMLGEAPPGVCSRWTDTAPCGAAAAFHVIWAPDGDGGVVNGLCCPAHEREIRRRWVYVGLHPYVPAVCSHPRAHWLADADRCAVPDDAAESVAEEATAGV